MDETEFTRTMDKTVKNGQKEHLSTDRDTCLTEEKGQTTMVTRNYINTDFMGLRTVPVLLKNGGHSLKINALLDDASTKSYLNADVAAELGLQGKTETVTVNVLNGQKERFETTSVSVELRSVAGDVGTKVNAYTVNRVTGNMPVIEWNAYKTKWPHLRNIEFPASASKPIVDMLIGLDCADLLYPIQEVRGKPGEPMARLTPLGWTCIGNPGTNYQELRQINFAFTYFVKDQSVVETISPALKQFWETENVPSHDVLIVRIEDQQAKKKVENSLPYINQMYTNRLSWKTNPTAMPDNNDIKFSRLENKEKISPVIELSNLEKAFEQQKAKQSTTETMALQELKESKAEKEGEPVIEEVKAGDRLRIQELEIDRASIKQELLNTNSAVQAAKELCRTLQTENKLLEQEIVKEKTVVLQITAEKKELEQHLGELAEEHDALTLEKKEADSLKLENKLQPISQKYEAEAHEQHDNFEDMCRSMLEKESQLNEVRDRIEEKTGHTNESLHMEQDKSADEMERDIVKSPIGQETLMRPVTKVCPLE